MKKPDVLSCLMMALVGAMWGLHGPAIKFAIAAGFTSQQLAVGEYLVGMSVFGAVVAWQRQKPPADARFWKLLGLAGVIGCGVPFFLFRAYQLGPVSIGATLLFLYVPFTQLLNWMITRQAPEGREVFSAVLVVTGAVLAMDVTGFAEAENLRGAPSAVAAAFCFAAFFVTTSRLGYSGTPALRSFICCLISGGLLLGLAVVGRWDLTPEVASPEIGAVWLISLGLFGQVVPIFLMVHFGPRTGSGLGSILTATELPVAVAASVALLGDPLGKWQVAGVLLVLVGIVWPHLPRLAAQFRAAPDGP